MSPPAFGKIGNNLKKKHFRREEFILKFLRSETCIFAAHNAVCTAGAAGRWIEQPSRGLKTRALRGRLRGLLMPRRRPDAHFEFDRFTIEFSSLFTIFMIVVRLATFFAML